MSDTTISYSWHPYPRLWTYAMGIFACTLGALVLWLTSHQKFGVPSVLGYVFVVLGFFTCVEQQTRIDTESHRVYREGRLFGWLRLWFTRRPLGDFTAVTLRRVQHYDDAAGGNDSVFVGLKRQTGRVMEVCYFTVANGYPCERAHSEAQGLAQMLGLPLDEHVA
jgi:hypothetical protein